jgi:hypothetical protein
MARCQPLPHQRNRADEWLPPPGEHDSDRVVGWFQRAWTVRQKVRLVEVKGGTPFPNRHSPAWGGLIEMRFQALSWTGVSQWRPRVHDPGSAMQGARTSGR